MQISESGIIEVLKNVKKGSFIRVHARTNPKTTVKSRVTGEPLDVVFGTKKVYKVSERTVQVGCDYENVVNARRVREGVDEKFTSAGTYGDLEDNVIIHKKDGGVNVRTYGTAIPNERSTYIREDGSELEPELVSRLKEEFMPMKSTCSRQGIENEFTPIDFKIESIMSIRYAGVDYFLNRS